MKSNAMLMPAVWGGLLLGVLSALPIVAVGNVCCCLWIVLGGALAAYVLQSNTPQPITPGDGALVGLLAGIIGAVVQAIVSLPIKLLMGPFTQKILEQVQQSISSQPDVPDNVRQMLERLGGSSGAFSLIAVVMGFMFMLCIGAVFATLGGLLGAVIFKKKPVVTA